MWQRLIGSIPVLAACTLSACDRGVHDAQPAEAVAHAPGSSGAAPSPFDMLKLGMSRQDVLARFPAGEDLAQCEVHLSGGDPPWPLGVASKADRPRSVCVRSLQIAGFNKKEAALLAQFLAGDSDGDRQRDRIQGLMYIMAQVRGAVRAGAVPPDDVVRAAPEGTTWSDAAVLTTGMFFDGAETFVTPQSARRPICATVASDCDGLDAAMVRKYVGGGFSLDELDERARDRVADGKCRGPYVSREKSFQREFVRTAGAFTGLGLARSSRSDRKLDPDKPNSFSIYATRSKLKASQARLGVLMANSLAETEAYWKGAVALELGTPSDAPWSFTVVWLRDDRVQRILLSLGGADAPEQTKTALDQMWGPGESLSAHATRWNLGESGTAQLDWGPAMSLVLEAMAKPVMTQTSPELHNQ